MVTATRLAENSSLKILLVEAGGDDRTNPLIYDIHQYSKAFGTNLDWAWPADQGRVIRGGKTLGGSTSINGAAWTRGLASQYDALSSLLLPAQANLNWTWANLFGYMKKAETFSAPNSGQKAKGATSDPSAHGTTGPIQVTFSDTMFGGPEQPNFVKTITNLTGMPQCQDLSGGTAACVAFTPNSIDWHRSDHRSSSVEGYWTPVEGRRQGLTILTTYTVTKILFTGTAVPLTAKGINFKSSQNTGSTYTAFASKEVILAAGAIQSPALLQLSGIGDPIVLNPLGIQVLSPLVSVGLNLQEQTMNSLGARGNGFDAGGTGPSDCIGYPNLDQLYGSTQAAIVKKGIMANLTTWAQSQASAGSVLSAQALQQVYAVQADQIVNKGAPVVELFYDTGFPE
jgi:choline dehydrogenase-like flavoprotein